MELLFGRGFFDTQQRQISTVVSISGDASELFR